MVSSNECTSETVRAAKKLALKEQEYNQNQNTNYRRNSWNKSGAMISYTLMYEIENFRFANWDMISVFWFRIEIRILDKSHM